MQTYLIKRFLLMIPTIFGISLVVFTVINLAPGEPAAMSATGGEGGKILSTEQTASAESYQIFKKQFNLDKPLLLNFRPWLETAEVEEELHAWIAGTDKERIAAYSTLSDWGPDAVPHLVATLEKARKAGEGLEGDALEANLAYRSAVVRMLSLNSLTDVEDVDSAEGQALSHGQLDAIARNKAVQVENNLRRERAVPEGAAPEEQARIERLWVGWFEGWRTIVEAKQKTVPPETIQTPFAEALRSGTEEGQAAGDGKVSSEAAKQAKVLKSLREAGRGLGRSLGPEGLESLVAWVKAKPLSELADATWFAASALDEMLPEPEDPTDVERTDRRNQTRALIAGRGEEWRDARLQAVRERWRRWWEGREDTYQTTGVRKVTTLLFDTRFGHYWYNLIRLDFGESLQYKGKKVIDLITSRLKISITFSLTSFLIAYLISIPLGIYSAVYKDSLSDRIITVVLFALYSLPSFFVAVLLQRYLTIGDPLKLFPTTGFQSAGADNYPVWDYLLDVGWHLVLPVFCLSYMSFATLSRYMRSGLLDVIQSDYIRTARAKGLSEWVVILKHALRNGLIPILTLVGGILPVLMGGSVILEKIFNIPGLGLLMLDAIFQRDYNIVMADSLIVGFLVLLGLLLSDILYVMVDPRISFE